MCEAIIFDMDGLMIDSEPLWHLAELECFATVNVTLSENDMLETTGLRIDEVVELNYQKFNWDESTLPTRQQVTTAIVDTMERLLTEKASTIKKPGLYPPTLFVVPGTGPEFISSVLVSTLPLIKTMSKQETHNELLAKVRNHAQNIVQQHFVRAKSFEFRSVRTSSLSCWQVRHHSTFGTLQRVSQR